MADSDVPSQSAPPRRTSPKSPPPPKLKLDEFKPILPVPATLTNTSSNSASNSGTAFVFTSSRTSRSGLSTPSISSTVSPPSSPLVDPRFASKPRPVLTAYQLARHSVGAVDARCIVGPNMRAAGFVPLAHTLTPQAHSHHHSQSLPHIPSDRGEPPSPTISITSVTSGVPTPSEPPPFPPIMFVNPSQMTAVPIWDYQRQLGWGIPQGKNVINLEPISSQPSVLGAAFEPSVGSESRPSMSHTASYASIPSSSSASIFSPVPTSSSVSSIPSTSPRHMLDNEKMLTDSGKARHVHSLTPPVDGYPFPHTPPPRPTESKSPSNSSSSTGVSAYSTATEHTPEHATSKSPPQPVPPATISSRPPPANPVVPSRPLPIPMQKEDKKAPSFRQSTRILRDARGEHSRSRSADLSLTQLCQISPGGAWVTDPNVFGPFETKPRNTGSSSESVSGSSSSGKVSRGRSRASSIVVASDRAAARERRLSKDGSDLTTELADLTVGMEVVKEESPEKEGLPVVPQDDAEKGREWARFKEAAERKRRKGKERRRNKTDSDSDGKAEAGKAKQRSGGEKQSKARAHAQMHSFSSFSFPPGPSKPGAVHVLEHVETSPKLEPRSERTKKSSTSRERREREREHQRGKDLGALVQAHRLHDREQAKQSERENRGREKQRAIVTIDSTEYDNFDQNTSWEKSYKKHSRPYYQTKPRNGDQKPPYLCDLTSDGETMVDLETRV